MSLVLGVIPARFASTRFPGKVLAPLGDRPLVEEVWRRARRAARLDRLIVATDDPRVVQAAEGFGAEAMMTREDHPSGTDRAAEVVRCLGDEHDVIVVIQADEPLLTPTSLDRLVECFDAPEPPSVATLSEPIRSAAELFDPNVVKLVAAASGRALYFSRSPIPFHRGDEARLQADFRKTLAARSGGLAGYLRHQGIYAYAREALLELTALAPAPAELDEGLEQLRALHAGYAIQVVESDFQSHAVDTPDDLERVARLLAEA